VNGSRVESGRLAPLQGHCEVASGEVESGEVASGEVASGEVESGDDAHAGSTGASACTGELRRALGGVVGGGD
jgi:hypothetical protein